MTEQQELSEWEKQQGKNARHRALIMQILTKFPKGLTTQQIVEKELDFHGYSFLTDNRLRELRKKGWVESVPQKGKPQLWRVKSDRN